MCMYPNFHSLIDRCQKEKETELIVSMAKSKEDIKYATAQARVSSEDEGVRVAYVNGTPLEAGKIAESEPVDLFSSAHNIAKCDRTTAHSNNDDDNNNQPQLQPDTQEGSTIDFTTGPPRLPKEGPPPSMAHKS